MTKKAAVWGFLKGVGEIAGKVVRATMVDYDAASCTLAFSNLALTTAVNAVNSRSTGLLARDLSVSVGADALTLTAKHRLTGAAATLRTNAGGLVVEGDRYMLVMRLVDDENHQHDSVVFNALPRLFQALLGLGITLGDRVPNVTREGEHLVYAGRFPETSWFFALLRSTGALATERIINIGISAGWLHLDLSECVPANFSLDTTRISALLGR